MEHQPEMNEMLLVLDKQKNQISAVKKLGKNSKLETVPPDEKGEPQFMRMDRNGNFFSNLFSNFQRQLKDPTRFDFFRVPVTEGKQIAAELQQHLNHLGAAAQKLMSKYALNAEYQHKNHNSMDTQESTGKTEEYRFQPEQVNWKSLADLGLTKDRLEKIGALEPLLKGYKTDNLIPLTLTMGDAVAKLDARLSLQQNDAGQVVVAMHGIRKEPNLNYPFFGHEFTKEDKENLLNTGNMGRVVDLFNQKTSEFVPSVISVDRRTNELVAYKVEWMQIPDEIKGIKLNEQQKQTLQEGKPLQLEGMTSKKGEAFDATVQFNADKRYVEFLFDRNGQNQSQGRTYAEAPKEFRGKELTDEQHSKLKEGLTVYVSGLTDKHGKEYQGYITYNQESGKVGFSFNNPSKSKEEAMPAEAKNTQPAAKAENNASEETKSGKQQKATHDKTDTAAEEQQAPARKRGMKI